MLRAVILRLLVYLGLPLLAVGVLWGVSIRMPGRSFAGAPPPLSAEERATAERLRRDVTVLADSIGDRDARTAYAGLARASAWLQRQGTAIAGRPPRVQEYQASGRTVQNLEFELSTGDQRQPLVVGAHYDAIAVTRGADDNASGVAVVLELMRRLRATPADCPVLAVLFTNEEPPYFYSDSMGSLVYARALVARGMRPRAMFSLESVGYFSDAPGSQEYPPLLGWFYPDRGDFIAIVGNVASRALVHRTIADFRRVATLPSAGSAAPGWFPGVGWSDHWAFWQVGVPAVMVTGTAPYRNRNYHESTDVVGTLDFGRMARVVTGVERVLREACRAA